MNQTGKQKHVLTGLPSEEKQIINKAKPLLALSQSEMTLTEFKILDIYLSRIDTHHPENRVVQFEKGEIENVLGVEKINNPELRKRLKHLMANVVELPDKDGENGFMAVTLFEEAVAKQDENGLWQIRMECTQKAMKYFFNIDNLGYLRYKLRCVKNLSSRYSYVMFLYIEANRYRKTWDVTVENLKHILSCDSNPTYQQYYRFNDLVLKKCYKELSEKTECRYDYQPVRKGHKVVSVRFTVRNLEAVEAEPERKVKISANTETDILTNLDDKELIMLQSICSEDHFSKEELSLIQSVLEGVPESLLPGKGKSEKERRKLLLEQCYRKMIVRSLDHTISNRLKYLVSILQRLSDAKSPTPDNTVDPGFPQRDDDLDALALQIQFDDMRQMQLDDNPDI